MMKNRKDMVIVALATFCLTATLFLTRPTSSQAPSELYDPWIDNNHDGQINILDSIRLANIFLTSGDPTANVNVTNFPSQQNVNVINLHEWKTVSVVENLTLAWNVTSVPYYGGFQTSAAIPTDGYSRMRICARITDVTDLGAYNNSMEITLSWNSTFDYGVTADETWWDILNMQGQGIVGIYQGPFVQAYPGQMGNMSTVSEPYLTFYIRAWLNVLGLPAPTVVRCTVSIEVYFRNE